MIEVELVSLTQHKSPKIPYLALEIAFSRAKSLIILWKYPIIDSFLLDLLCAPYILRGVW